MSMELRQALEQVARRFRHVRLWSGLAVCWLAWAFVGWGLALVLPRMGVPAIPNTGLWAFGAAAVTSAVICALVVFRSARDPRWVARKIEAIHPELKTGLLVAVEQAEESPAGKLGFLQTAVIRQALAHRRTHNWDEIVPTWTLRGSQVVHAMALCALLVVGLVLAGEARTHAKGLGLRKPGGEILADGDVKVDPGNTELERGTSLLVVARFHKAVPPEASLVVSDNSKAASRRPMTRSLEDPTFAGRVDSVESDLTYRVEYGGLHTETYRVTVFEYPELQRTDAKLVFPKYTGLEPKTVEDVRHVTAVEGSDLTLLFRLNKDVATARLVDGKGQTIALTPDGTSSNVYKTNFTLSESRRFKVQLTDKQGRANKIPADFVVNVTPNRPATVKMTRPAHDAQVSPIEELPLKADLDDDYGVARYGVSYTLAGQPPREVELQGAKSAGKKVKGEHLLDFESLNVKPDELVTYFFWAEDLGPDGKPRRTSGDMFFAEVRHFEEIFRQGEQPSGGEQENQGEQGENAQAAEQLAELQKEAINGTWKVIRREIGSKPSERFADDSKLLLESQQSVIKQAGQVGERLQNAESKGFLEEAVRFMKEAERQLETAVKQNSIPAHSPALVAEQSAYQALLKLRAREFNVVRGNRQRSRGGRGGASASQRQLQQLELSNDENRYEQQSSANADQEKLSTREREQRELRQVLNRLRELAQRQTDLNERLKELQSALEAAKDQKAREEIERQLKRLRDQQEQVLRDADEVRERMENDENRERMADARQQMEQGREHVRQASEALQQGQLSQAITEGARAGQQLNNLREDLRKSAGNRFSETLTEMRDQARQLDKDQKQLTEQLDEWNKNPQRTLRDTGDRAQIKQRLENQQTQLDKLLDRMRQTVEDAEENEPLLARGLYETARKANEKKIPDALKVAEQLVEAGVPEDAAKASQFAGQGLEQLREGVERAAESVLGDETTALKRAQGELDNLADQINRELAQAEGREPPGDQAANRPANRRGGQAGGNQAQTKRNDAQQNGEQEGQEQGQGQEQPGERGNRRNQQAGQGGREGERNPTDRNAQRKGQRGQRRTGAPEDQQAGQEGQQEQQGQEADQQGQQGNEQGQQGQQGQQGRGQGNQQGQEPQRGNQDGQQQGQGQQGNQQGQQGQGQQQGGNRPGGNRTTRDGGDDRQRGGPGGGGGGNRRGEVDRMLDGLERGPGGPITGDGFREWVDRMRDVEELLEDPDMRAEAARIRDRVRGAREDFKRHAKMPDWNQLKTLVADPIHELRNRVADEVRRRESPDSLVPIDRDPVPPQYTEAVRRYYERLGSGR